MSEIISNGDVWHDTTIGLEAYRIGDEWLVPHDDVKRRIAELQKENEVIRAALELAGLVCVWDGPNKAQIVCAPGRFEHARTALALD